MEHGKYSTYVNKSCRCDECKQAARDYRARLTARGLPADDDRHGTRNGYTNYGCRCAPCRIAMSDPKFALGEHGFGDKVWIRELGGWFVVGEKITP